jgi:hypothetical protein
MNHYLREPTATYSQLEVFERPSWITECARGWRPRYSSRDC